LASHVSAVAIVCVLLFLEEAGLPLPVAPGEAALIGAGLLVASGAVPVWVMAPLAYVAVIGGVLTGYAWAHRIGPKRVHALAVRLHAGGPYDRAAARLRAATPIQVALSRLLPGLRVYTSLVAGAVGLKVGQLMIGVLPASALWVAAFLGLGLFVGAPIEPVLGRFETYGLRAAVVALVVVVWVVAARRMPADKRAAAAERRRSRWRLAGAVGLDLIAISIVVGALSLFTIIARGDSDELDFMAAIFALLSILYLLVARQTVGHTLGEALIDVTYHPPRRRSAKRT
jgi:membrane protein DedA with SNARE-associated domain